MKLYRERMRLFAGMRTLDVWYAQDDADQLNALLQDKKIRRRTSRAVAKARTRDSLQVSGKLTHVVDGVRRIAADPPLITPIGDLAPGTEREELEQSLRKAHRRLRAQPLHRTPEPSGTLPSGRPGAQGGRGGERRYPLLDRPHGRPGRR